MRRLLKLKHHKHTGKLLHHRHTSYRALFGIVLTVGALIVMTGRIANADDLQVNATVPAPIPAGAPVFTAPPDGTVTDNPSVTFEGTCPVITPAVIITLYDGPTLIGSGPCLADGTFRITATIAEGARVIVATVVTITNENGESSDPLHVTYIPKTPTQEPNPGTSPPSTGTDSTGPGIPTPLQIIADKPFLLFSPNKPIQWKGRFEGGTPPYKITLAWGDGHTTVENGVTTDPQTYTYIYRENRNYTLTVSVSDTDGQTLTRNFAAISAGAPVGSGSSNTIVQALGDLPIDTMTLVLSLYGSLFVSLLSLWGYEFVHYRNAVGTALHYDWHHRNRPKVR